MRIFYNANGINYSKYFFLFNLQQKPDVNIKNEFRHVKKKKKKKKPQRVTK